MACSASKLIRTVKSLLNRYLFVVMLAIDVCNAVTGSLAKDCRMCRLFRTSPLKKGSGPVAQAESRAEKRSVSELPPFLLESFRRRMLAYGLFSRVPNWSKAHYGNNS